MKRHITKTVQSITLFLFIFCFLTNVNAQNIAIEQDGACINCPDLTADPSAALEVRATNRGVPIPRLTNTSAVANPVAGLMIYDNSVNAFQYYDGTTWQKIGGVDYISFPADGNSFVGVDVGTSNTTGDYNTVMGYQAFSSNTGGSQNAAFGFNALVDNITGNSNMAIGSFSLFDNTTGSQNVGIGSSALADNTTGNQNVAVGNRAMYYNTAGYSNVGIGVHALYNNITASNIVAVGDSALYNNGVGATFSYEANDNTAIGSKSLYSNTTGYGNTVNGSRALYSNTTGINNTAIGNRVLPSNTGDNNTVIGSYALNLSEQGSYNTAIGASTSIGSSYSSWWYDGYNSTVIGYQAYASSSNQIRLGNSSITSIGGYVNWSTISDSRFKTQIQSDVPGLAFIRLLSPVTYQMDMDAIAKHHHTSDSLRLAESERAKAAIHYTGFLAQDVEKAAASVAYDFSGVDAPQHERDNYSLRYAEFVVPLVKAVQELDEKNGQLKMENEALRAQNTNLEARLDKIEALLGQ